MMDPGHLWSMPVSRARSLLQTGPGTAGAHPCEWDTADGCRGDSTYFIGVGGLSQFPAALTQIQACLNSPVDALEGCDSNAPSYCETKYVPGEDQDLAICARPDSIVTGSNIFAIAGAASGDFEGRCPLEATLEGGTTSRGKQSRITPTPRGKALGTTTRSSGTGGLPKAAPDYAVPAAPPQKAHPGPSSAYESNCQSTYDALFELSGCLSCTEDVRVFQYDVMEACERISSRSECTSEDARIEVEEMLCDITQPVASLNCLNNEEISRAIEGVSNSTAPSGGSSAELSAGTTTTIIVLVFVLSCIIACIVFCCLRCRRRAQENVKNQMHAPLAHTNGAYNPNMTYPQHGVHMHAPAVPGIPVTPQPQHPLAHTYSAGQPQPQSHMHAEHALNIQRSNQAGSIPSALPSYHIPSPQHGPGSVHSMGSTTFTSPHATPPRQQQPYIGSVQSHNAWGGSQQAGHHAYTTTPPPLPPTMPFAQPQHQGALPADRVKVTCMPGAPGGFTVLADTFATLNATSVASNLASGGSPADVLDAQLDYLQARHDGSILGFLKLAPFLGRRMGGQGAVAFAHHKDTAATLYAIKFFFSSKAFEVERAAACNQALRALMPPVATIEDDAAALAAATARMPAPLCEHPLPPAIVTEKGESLDEFVARSAPDRFTALQVMVHIACKLEQLHAAGYVHRDLKPGNAIWLPSQNSWTLIDFGCAARAGATADLNFSLYYAPPEVVIAFKDGRQGIQVAPAIDVWSLGVICWELLTKYKFYGAGADMNSVVAMLRGDRPLPTEGQLPAEVSQMLGSGALREAIFSALHRDPLQRPSVASLLSTWTSIF